MIFYKKETEKIELVARPAENQADSDWGEGMEKQKGQKCQNSPEISQRQGNRFRLSLDGVSSNSAQHRWHLPPRLHQCLTAVTSILWPVPVNRKRKRRWASFWHGRSCAIIWYYQMSYGVKGDREKRSHVILFWWGKRNFLLLLQCVVLISGSNYPYFVINESILFNQSFYNLQCFLYHNSPICDEYQTQLAWVLALPWKRAKQDDWNETPQPIGVKSASL